VLAGSRHERTEGRAIGITASGKDSDNTLGAVRGHDRLSGVRVLVVEDDAAIAEPLAVGLRREGFDVDCVSDRAAALAAPPADLVLLDLGLPDGHGFDVCRALRTRSTVPIIIVTARDDEVDRVAGLELGADDYVVKPFGFRELVARIRAVTRRAAGAAGAPGAVVPQRVGELEIDRRSHRVRVGGEEIALTPKEFELLSLLASDPGAMVTRREILAEVWDPHWYGTSKTVDVHIASLRRKLAHPEWIETCRGVGFRLAVPG
jgi:two-component system, OmpR family, response regulator RegX3